ncbi:MAG: prepilin-type N-terminal cleavage/methylation domain-containing protein [Candidatus Hydrogenedentes bacterium]|nr:prepilin-type N-terminal cleavage/methylation domain-containing protein [Candidatus Hydrogenedentota bacterium]
MGRQHKDRAGFTLVEIVVALTIISVGIVAVMRLFPESLRQARTAAERTTVAFLAKTQLGKVRASGLGGGLGAWAANNSFQNVAAAGSASGGFYQSYRATTQRVSGDVNLYRITFSVQLFDGREEQFVTYVTEQ